MTSSLPYHEPSIETILKQSSFIIVLNGINHVLDATVYCGLVGQILIGIAWGAPGGKILTPEAQDVIVQLGYIGLILLVFEGGLSTSFSSLKANFLLSTLVAVTGIAAPMGLSFILSPLIGASSLQAFAAGAALCSTSLGTTFTLLGTSGLSATRLGVVLTSAAMMDDVVGLIMVQVISNLGASSSLDAVTIIRPVFVSLAFATLLPLVCRFVVLPVTRSIVREREQRPASLMSRIAANELTALSVHTATLIGIVAGATYAGTSGLLGAYIAGAMISWWDAEAPHLSPARDEPSSTPETQQELSIVGQRVPDAVSLRNMNSNSGIDSPPHPANTSAAAQYRNEPSHSGSKIFEKYYQPALERILKPFFFVRTYLSYDVRCNANDFQASVGFSIPITQMFTGSVVWRGVVYTILMTIGKLVCGLWLLRLPNPFTKLRRVAHLVKHTVARKRPGSGQPRQPHEPAASSAPKTRQDKPLSVYPGLILGCAMVSRGEIGYLISSIAEGGGIFSQDNPTAGKRSAEADVLGQQPSEIFLIVTWAITLCTILGPVSMGLLVDRVRKLESKAAKKDNSGGRLNVLGSWGVS